MEASEENNAVLREAYLMKQLCHPCIPKIYDIEEHENGFCIIEEYIQGESFYSYCRTKNPGMKEIIALMVQLCSVLAYLHNREPKILHLDLKPDNILVNNGKLFLIDFGSAVQGAGIRERGLTGTPGFAAPECYQGEAREQSDVFGAGKLMEFMLKQQGALQPRQESQRKKPRRRKEARAKGMRGKSAWKNKSFQKCLLHKQGRMEKKQERSMQKRLLRIIEKATRERPSDRYPSASAMRYALETLQNWNKTEKSDLLSQQGEGEKRCRVIALAGSGRRMGVTLFALHLTSFFSARRQKALYLECNESDAVLQMLLGTKALDYSKRAGKAEEMFYFGVPVEESRSCAQARGSGEGYQLGEEESYYAKKGYQVLIEDFGALTPENVGEFLKADLSLLFVGSKDWELDNTWKCLCMLQRQQGHFLVMVNYAKEKEFRRFAGELPEIPCRRVPYLPGMPDKNMQDAAGGYEELLEELFEMAWQGAKRT